MADPTTLDHQQKKLIKSKSGLKIVLINDNHQSPFILNEPPWVPDREVMFCIGCKVKFSFTIRKHHCRRCGSIFCDNCCSQKVWLPRMCFMDPVRVCDPCAMICGKEQDFFDSCIYTLQSGATFLLSPLDSAVTTCLCLCKLSRNQQCLLFDSVANIPALPIESITDYRISLTPNSGSNFVEILCDNGGVRLTAGPESHRLAGLVWIEALDRGLRLIDITSSASW